MIMRKIRMVKDNEGHRVELSKNGRISKNAYYYNQGMGRRAAAR